MYPNDSLRLYAEWETFVIKIIGYAKTMKISYVEEQLNEIERETIASGMYFISLPLCETQYSYCSRRKR